MIRAISLASALAALALPHLAIAQSSVPGMAVVPVGYCQLTSIDASTLISSCSGGIPAGANTAWIVAEAQAVRWRDDGTAPTSSVGFPVAVATPWLYTGRLSAVRVIAQTSGAKLNVLFYKSP